MPDVSGSHHGRSGADRSAGKDGFAQTLFAFVGVMAVFIGLVALPQTRSNLWSSNAGYSDVLVGP